ncbi:hypothetical protein GA0061101_14928 [Rhizobium lusitanum]|jgi:hypothetical protein|uniref:Uncharacterized protein n=1 Tax=Rhizobium lusitanum TaxID=293958 RepID=A0A1C3XJE6_9HYPH|nr:hypothetical protein GA0061101_14928 [Rhizobium lusitanum]
MRRASFIVGAAHYLASYDVRICEYNQCTILDLQISDTYPYMTKNLYLPPPIGLPPLELEETLPELFHSI